MADETKSQQGNLPSADGSGTTPETTPTFTREQTEALVSKAKSDALAELGRYKKAADDAVKQVQAIEERLSRLQEERFDSELEAVKDDPDKLRDIRARQKETKERISAESDRRKWEADKASYDERIKRAEATERRELAREVAGEFKVDYKTLEKFGADRESMVDLAKALPKSGQQTRVTEPPESGKTKGTGGMGRKPTLEEVQATSPEEFDAKIKSGEWKVF